VEQASFLPAWCDRDMICSPIIFKRLYWTTYRLIKRRREMNVSGQVMVGMFASHAPSLHSLLSIITHRENCCWGMKVILWNFRMLNYVVQSMQRHGERLSRGGLWMSKYGLRRTGQVQKSPSRSSFAEETPNEHQQQRDGVPLNVLHGREFSATARSV
jgi:hypothetical protein